MSKEKKVAGKAFDLLLLKRIIALIKPYKKYYFLNAGLIVLLALIGPARPFLIQYAVDHFVIAGDLVNLKNITFVLIGLLIVESIFRYFFTYYAAFLAQNTIKDLRERVFNHITGLKMKFFDSTPIGTLTTRTISDIESISQVFSEGLLTIIGDLLTLVVILVLMLITDWKLALVSLSLLPVLLIGSYIFKEAVKNSFQDVRKEVSKQNTFLQEHITGMNIVQIFNREKAEYQKFKDINKDLQDANLRAVLAYSIFFPVVEIITAASLGLVVWWGASKVFDYEGSFGAIIAFTMYVNMFFRPVRMLADKFNALQMGMVASERVFSILDTKEFIADQGTTVLKQVHGKIEFKNVVFGYNPETPILKNISFKVNAGTTTALVGATGSGKTSIINVLNRFYEYQSGTIALDEIDIRNIALNSLKGKIGVILQDVFLFSGTIFDNITLRNKDISFETVQGFAQMSGIDKFIEKLPGGYNYEVMERGYALSAGQRQLIAFLRAMVFNPAVLVLDEATSSVDTETEEILQRATQKLTENRTSIIVAHRLSTIQNADQILVIEQGQIAESGNHQSLLQKEGIYHNLYEMQFKMLENQL